MIVLGASAYRKETTMTNYKTDLMRPHPLHALDAEIHRLQEFCTLRLGKRPARRQVETAMLRHLLNTVGTSANDLLELSHQLFPDTANDQQEAPL